ncbi:apoptotic chromatin condensation inducer in the nucleus [Rhinatrema bivittatum]|uniref:apoptotic chromatin condensation inducer in the nucleus n=1 Tax=Rhinatrema bivittatum TaxID=194408 RepID=UPI0011291A4A|nr:apoptotic chromatin condensation inducer in the nucleus [Rhinatrema bivittatum]
MADLEDVTLDGRPLQSLRVTDLKAALEERGLPKSGQKSALVKRLKGALMLENLQKHSTPHSGLQPNSQIGEEMCQNSFIKQYLEKQQELLRQRLEREAREAAEIGDKGLVALSEKEDSEEELPRKRERRSPRVQQTRTKTPSAEEEQEPHLRPRRAKLEWDVKLAEEEEEEEEEEGEEEEWNAVRAPAVARKHRDVSRKKPMTGVQPSLAGRYPSPPELLEGEDSASLEARVPPLLSKETFGDQCAPLIERSKGRTSPGGKVSPVKEKAEELTPIQGSCFHILDKTGHWAPVVAYPVSAKAGRKPPSPAQLYRTEKKEAKPAPHFEVSETIKRPTSPVCRAQESLLSLGPAVREPQHKKQRQEPSGDTVKDPAPETQREKFPGPVRQDLEPQRQKQESPGPISQNPSSETLRQESPGPAVAESETLRQEFPGPAVVESETLRQEFPGPAVVESETLRQESPGPAVAESERLRQESPGPAVAESERLRQESPGPAVPESERLRQKSPGPAVPESERLRQESPGPAVAESERLRQESPGPAVVESERLRQESPGPAVAESERLRQESPGPAVAESERLRQESPGPAVAESERLRQEFPGPAVAESERLRQESPGPAVVESERLRQESPGPAVAESERLRQESPGPAVAESERLRQESPGSAVAEYERLRQESPGPAVAESERLRQEFPGPAVVESETLRQESPGPAVAESETLRQESPGPAVVESEAMGQESPGPAVAESERLSQEFPGPAIAESERMRQESPGPAVAESERLRQETPGPAVAESETLRQEFLGLAVAESERLRQESPGPAVAESERLRQESPGPAVAESERLRQESPGPAVAESETHLLKSTGLPPQDPKSETLISESSCCAVAEPQTQKLERPGSAPEDPWESSSPSMEDPVTVTWKHQFPGPAVKEREPEAVKQKSPSLVTSQDPESEPQRRLCPGAPGTENGTALVVQHPAERPGVSTMSQLPAGAGTEFHSTEGEQGRSTESPAETPQGQRQRAPSRSPSSSRQRRTPSFSSRSSSSESSSRSSSRYRSRSSSSWRSRSRSRSGSDSASRSRSRSTSSSRSRTSRRSRSSLGVTLPISFQSGSPEPHRDSPSGGRAVVQEHPPAPTESAPEGSAPPKPPRLHRNRWNVGPEQNTAAAALPVQQQESLQEPWQRPPEQEGCVLHPDSEQEAAAVEVVAPQAGGAAGIARVPMAQKVHEHEPRKSRDNVSVEKEAAMDTEESRPEAEGASETELRDTVASDPNEERTEAAPPSEEDEKKESTTLKALKRKISVVSANKGANQQSACTAAGNSDSEAGHPTRKRRWGASTATTQKKPSISITTESLKSLIPDIKPLAGQEAVVDLHADEVHMSEDESERNGGESPHDKGLKICRTVTQVVPAEAQENGQGEEEEKEQEEEPLPAPQTPEVVVVEPEPPPPVEPEVKKVTLSDTLLRRSISRQKSGVSITIDDPVRTSKVPSPPRGKVTPIVHICNLVRPFTLGQLKELLSRTGTLVEENFWIDKIKSHCYVTYSTVEEALATRNALHGVKWPQSNPKFLSADFAEQDELDFHRGLLVNRPQELKPEEAARLHGPHPPHVHHHAPSLRAEHREQERTVREQWAEREREMQRRERTRAEREWDRDKIRESGRSRSRSRDRRRKERAKSKDKKSERKSEKKEKVLEEPPAKLLDDLFRKTKAAPCIYWLPLTDEQSARRVTERAERAKEREKRRKEQEDQEEEEERKGRAKEREKEAERERNREKRREQSRERGRDRERRDTKRHSRSASRSATARDRGGRR